MPIEGSPDIRGPPQGAYTVRCRGGGGTVTVYSSKPQFEHASNCVTSIYILASNSTAQRSRSRRRPPPACSGTIIPNNDRMRSLITDSPMSRYGTPLNVEVVWLRHLMHLITKAGVETWCPPNFPGGHSVQETRRGSHKCETPGGFRSGGGGI